MLETPTPAPAQFTAFGDGTPPAPTASLDVIAGVQLEIVVALGRTRMTVQQLLQLRTGSVIEIGQAGGLVEVQANGSLVASGEIVVVGDDLGVRIVDIPQLRPS
ncbi:MAG: FliM/FliN family flagellar motor switch protein [Actinomycetia bacterium]|nr:FliM/FliN family flagellar motor switch protein [Actinomycetes bacterium]